MSTLTGVIDTDAAAEVWDSALAAAGHDDRVWVHGDITSSNLLVVDGRLAAVIDFGCSAVGDPACDTTIAWTLFNDRSRAEFVSGLSLDSATWCRGRGWALWKALITLAIDINTPRYATQATKRFGWRYEPEQVIDEIIRDHQTQG